MKYPSLFFATLFVFLFSSVFSQSNTSASTGLDSVLYNNLKFHVYYLSDDSLEGRATATEGEEKAYRYIVSQFVRNGLQPAGKNASYLQPFTFVKGRLMGEKNSLLINKKSFHVEKDYYPLGYSANKKINGACVDVGFGISAPDLEHDDYKGRKNLKGKVFLINVSSPSGTNPHGKFGSHLDLRPRVERAIQAGATAVIFYANEEQSDYPPSMLDRNIFPASIPIVFLKKHGWDEVMNFKKLSAQMSVELIPIEKTGHNVAGLIDNNATTTVVLGAHYDHLGFGESGGSLHRGDSAIHNGADDNASGVALIIELARKLKSSPLKNNNYLVVAFSGEELGLYGSKQYLDFMNDAVKSVNYMLNYDMVGRLNPTERGMQVNGFGTSSAWQVLKNIPNDSINLKTTDSGIGPSDHTPFYLKDIPVLHFFTGAHEDYHKPTDVAEKVNYEGMVSIFNLSYALIDSIDGRGRIDFISVAADTAPATPRFKVTLGVIPDYMFSGEGMRLDGVTDGKPAASAGLKKGDIVIQIGEHKVADMMSYMEALSKFKKGDNATVIYLREGIENKGEVVF